ncbi:MAG: hypothetical protein DRP41_06345 [Thermodesulfobacteriota bacterium]|nr:MAG: hypothetical protein DRP41_06345 [Thermodesulfobacteriota bacterium]
MLKWSLLILIFLIPMIPTFWAIIELMTKEINSIYGKFIWLLFVIFIPCIGGLCYFLFGRKRLLKTPKAHV